MILFEAETYCDVIKISDGNISDFSKNIAEFAAHIDLQLNYCQAQSKLKLKLADFSKNIVEFAKHIVLN